MFQAHLHLCSQRCLPGSRFHFVWGKSSAWSRIEILWLRSNLFSLAYSFTVSPYKVFGITEVIATLLHQRLVSHKLASARNNQICSGLQWFSEVISPPICYYVWICSSKEVPEVLSHNSHTKLWNSDPVWKISGNAGVKSLNEPTVLDTTLLLQEMAIKYDNNK